MEDSIDTIDLVIAHNTPKHSPWYYMLNGELVKQMKPCLEGDYIHINKWNGCYRVYDVNVYGFCVLRNREYIWLRWEEFRCHKGNGDSPEKYQKLVKRATIHKIEHNIKLLETKLKDMMELKNTIKKG